MKINLLKKGEMVGIVAPSRPIYNIKEEISKGISEIKNRGFLVKKGEFLNKKDYYSAGNISQRVNDIHAMFSDKNIKGIFCATGGVSAIQLLDKLDFELIKKNPKIFMGYSDITLLLLAINKKSGITTFYGPNVREIFSVSKETQNFIFDMLEGKTKSFEYPKNIKIIMPGKAEGKLVGGLLAGMVNLLGTPYVPNFDNKIIFWEETGASPAIIDLQLQQLKLAGAFNKIKGMVIGHLDNCTDKKYPKDNKSIEEIISERTDGFSFPIIKVEYFGHNTNNFYSIPIGVNASLDTDKKLFTVNL